jgi:hypothetical protein
MTDMNETTPYLVVPEQPREQQIQQISLLETRIETSKILTTSSEHQEVDVGVKTDLAGGTTTASGGSDEPEVTTGVLKTETSSPVTGNEGEELPAGGEKVENLEVKSADNSVEQDFK